MTSAGPILVTGGTGTLGTAVVRALDGHDVRVLSRRNGPGLVTGDLRTGAGIDAAVAGVGTIVHCATALGKADVDLTRTLVTAAARAGRPHLVHVSIVGVDRIPLPYYRAKLATEQVVAESGLPWSVLRATQFHDLVVKLFSVQRRLPVVLVPAGFQVQPVDVRDVAGRLARAVSDGPGEWLTDFGGPEMHDIAELARRYLRSVESRRRVLGVRLPGRIAAGYRAGANTVPEHADGVVTFDAYLRD